MDEIDWKNFSKRDFIKEQEDRDNIFKNIYKYIGHKDFSSDDVQNGVQKLFDWMNKFYDCSLGMFEGLAEVYEFNPSFSQILVKNYGEDMPKYLSNAIIYFCNNIERKE